MKKQILAMLVVALLLLTACDKAGERDEGTLRIVATTYPVYLLTTAVTEGMANTEVTLMVQAPTACLHDYTLTVNDMKALESADVVVMNGAGLEDFMAAALAQSEATVIDGSAGIDLLLATEHEGHDGHDHDEVYDPHYWLDPRRATQMAQNIARGLGLEPPDLRALTQDITQMPSQLASRDLITFHDGFRYLAAYLDLTLLKSIEEEAGSEASAKDILEVTTLIENNGVPAIFTEKNGSDATAKAVARETAVKIYQLDTLTSGEGKGILPYIDGMNQNIATILEALG